MDTIKFIYKSSVDKIYPPICAKIYAHTYMQLQQIFNINDKILQIFPGKNAVVFVIESKHPGNTFCLKISPIRNEYLVEAQIYTKLSSDPELSKYVVPFCGYGYISQKIILAEKTQIFIDIRKFLSNWPNSSDFLWQITKYDNNFITMDVIERENIVDPQKMVIIYRQHVLKYLEMYKKFKIKWVPS